MPTSRFIRPGKLNMIVDGQFGSTGKGAIAARIAMDNHIDIAVGVLSPNAGHTYYMEDWRSTKFKKVVCKQLPVAGIVHKKSLIYLAAGSVIHPQMLLREMEQHYVEPARVRIHPRAAIITNESVLNELAENSAMERISSTQSGTGEARASKVLRTNQLAENCTLLRRMVQEIDLQHDLRREKLSVLVETGQGLGLGLNYGLAYPFCTSRDVLPTTVMSDCGIGDARLLGNVMATFRTFPIRVGNAVRDGQVVGYSGPFWSDSRELTWEELGQEPELTTVTGKVRRVATFSPRQYEDALHRIAPTHVFLNFLNYVREEDLPDFDFTGTRPPTHVGYGQWPEYIRPYDPDIIENCVYGDTKY